MIKNSTLVNTMNEKELGPPMKVNAEGCHSVTINANHRHKHYHYPDTFKGKESGNPSMEAIKQMIDVVIATTEDRATAGRLEICRAYLFNPLIGEGIERFIIDSLPPVKSIVKQPKKVARPKE